MTVLTMQAVLAVWLRSCGFINPHMIVAIGQRESY